MKKNIAQSYYNVNYLISEILILITGDMSILHFYLTRVLMLKQYFWIRIRYDTYKVCVKITTKN